MGDKWIVPYGLYRVHGFISAHWSARTGFSEEDLALFWEALGAMFDHDRSAARGEMTCRGVYAFRHDNALGRAPAHKLFELVKVQKTIAKEAVARSFGDYSAMVNETAIPTGVSLKRLAV
jgi:CRISPR-associated protein Csd2